MIFDIFGINNKKFKMTIFLLILMATLTGCHFPTPTPDYKSTLQLVEPLITKEPGTSEYKSTLQLVDTLITKQPEKPESTPSFRINDNTSDPTTGVTLNFPIPTPTPTPDPFANLYNCQMEIKFLSGPLEDKGTSFEVLGRDYFWEKGDKFEAGKGTGVFYESQHYFILHSSVLNGNIFHDLEAEFLRRYLENWGWVSTAYIQQRIDQLIGSEVVWICDGKELFATQVDGVTRLSHEASNRLWLEPRNIPDILEGNQSEWIGEIPKFDQDQILLGFCGWGPFSLGEERVTYYRYLISFDIQNYIQQ